MRTIESVSVSNNESSTVEAVSSVVTVTIQGMSDKNPLTPNPDNRSQRPEEIRESLLGSSWTSDPSVGRVGTSSTEELVDSDDD